MSYKRKNDYFFLLAKKSNIRARSYYKLEEIDKKYNFIKKKKTILDLGCYPGSWSEYCFKKTQNNINIIGIDLKETQFDNPNKNFYFIKKNILKIKLDEILEFFVSQTRQKNLDGLISDMAPSTSGIRDKDSYGSFELVKKALFLAKNLLRPGGFFIIKYFLGSEIEEIKEEMRDSFKLIKIFRPLATRKNSKEVFILGNKL